MAFVSSSLTHLTFLQASFFEELIQSQIMIVSSFQILNNAATNKLHFAEQQDTKIYYCICFQIQIIQYKKKKRVENLKKIKD